LKPILDKSGIWAPRRKNMPRAVSTVNTFGTLALSTGEGLKMPNEHRPTKDDGRFGAIFSSVPECVKRVGPDGALIDINPAGLAMIDADSAEQLRGRNLLELIDPAHHHAFREAVSSVFKGNSVQLQFEVIGLSGKRLWMDQSAAPLFDDNEPGKVVEMVAITRDITAQRAAEAALSRARVAEEVAKAKASFLANVGNDLKTPLNQIIGYSELLKEAAIDKGRQDEIGDIERVLEAAMRLSSTLNQILAISLEDARRVESDISAFDLTELVDDASARVKPILHAATTRVSLALEEAPQIWIGDRQKLDQCLRSVLSAASEFAVNGAIKIASRAVFAGGCAQLQLEILAAGDRLAERDAKQTSAAMATRELGASALQLARNTLRSMGGEMKISIEARGVSFIMRVPARPATNEHAPSQVAAPMAR